MPTVIEASYSKQASLPQCSSHRYTLTVRTELADLAQLDAESQRLHAWLQAAVDREIQIEGYVPEGEERVPRHGANGTNGSDRPAGEAQDQGWQCSNRQRELILTIAEERQLSLSRVEALAQDRFGKELRQLTRPQASCIITRLLTA